MSIVRRLFPQAPEIGSTTMIYLGVGKTAGRLHHAVVTVGPAHHPGVLVTVRLRNRCRLLEPIHTAHADCIVAPERIKQ
jgi:hypothetical protein